MKQIDEWPMATEADTLTLARAADTDAARAVARDAAAALTLELRRE